MGIKGLRFLWFYDSICYKFCIFNSYIIFIFLGTQPQEHLDNSDDEGANSTSAISEILLVPEDEGIRHTEIVKTMYDTMKLCQVFYYNFGIISIETQLMEFFS